MLGFRRADASGRRWVIFMRVVSESLVNALGVNQDSSIEMVWEKGCHDRAMLIQ